MASEAEYSAKHNWWSSRSAAGLGLAGGAGNVMDKLLRTIELCAFE
jgi:lipoprotein signal peptidase